MADTSKDSEADKRRDELARRVLKMPPSPRKPSKAGKPKKAKSQR